MSDRDQNQTKLERASTAGEDEAYCPQCGRSFGPIYENCPHDNARLVLLAAERDTLLGKVLDNRYEIRAPLGSGGMGTVYRGVQLSVDREVAIKVIHPKLTNDRNVVKRFLREARLASRLNQPSIVNVYDFGQSDGVLYLVTELLRGHTLASELGQGRRINIRRAATIGIQLCDALEAAHAQDIVHRDLKPGNIVILDDPPGRDLVKVLDFGLAKSLAGDAGSTVPDSGEQPAAGSHLTTNLGAVLGTPTYMAPEQIEGKASDQRADLYSLGIILYEMVNGAPPFADQSVSAVLARHIGDTPPPLAAHVPLKFRTLVERLLAKAPDDRVQAAGDVRRILQTTLEATPASGVPVVLVPNDGPDTMPDLRAALADTAAHTALADAPLPPRAASTRRIGTEPTVAAMAMPVAAASLSATEPTPIVSGETGPVAKTAAAKRGRMVMTAVFGAAALAAGVVILVSPGKDASKAGAVHRDAGVQAAPPPPQPRDVTVPHVDAAVEVAPPPTPTADAAPAIVLPQAKPTHAPQGKPQGQGQGKPPAQGQAKQPAQPKPDDLDFYRGKSR